MKIVHVLWSLGTGGTESLLADIVCEQSKDNTVFVIVVNDIVDLNIFNKIDKRCKVYFCKRKPRSRNPFPILKLNLLLWLLTPNIIHAHMDNLGKYLKIRRKAKVVKTIHCAMGNGHDHVYYDRLFAISNGVKKYVASQGFDSVIVYNGIHSDLISYKKKSNHEIVRIVNVGRLLPVKGQQLLVQAAYLLKNKGVKNFHIDFIGDGEEFQNLKKMIEKLNLQDEVALVGGKTREYIYANLCTYDLYVQPSISEGFGLTLSEAMAAGVPVLTSDQDGPMEVIDSGKYGFSFRTGDPEDLANKIELFLNKEIQVDTFAACDFVKKNFDVKMTACNYLHEYERLLRV